jgi:hypothetical protein
MEKDNFSIKMEEDMMENGNKTKWMDLDRFTINLVS